MSKKITQTSPDIHFKHMKYGSLSFILWSSEGPMYMFLPCVYTFVNVDMSATRAMGHCPTKTHET